MIKTQYQTIKVTHDNTDYVLDVPQAIKLGVLKKNTPPLKNGDVFQSDRNSKSSIKILLLKSYDASKYDLYGNSNCLDAYSESLTEEVFLEKYSHWHYVGNINEEFKTLLVNFCSNK